jgi:hypothetical protein
MAIDPNQELHYLLGTQYLATLDMRSKDLGLLFARGLIAANQGKALFKLAHTSRILSLKQLSALLRRHGRSLQYTRNRDLVFWVHVVIFQRPQPHFENSVGLASRREGSPSESEFFGDGASTVIRIQFRIIPRPHHLHNIA